MWNINYSLKSAFVMNDRIFFLMRSAENHNRCIKIFWLDKITQKEISRKREANLWIGDGIRKRASMMNPKQLTALVHSVTYRIPYLTLIDTSVT
jgi:hypothetical protein